MGMIERYEQEQRRHLAEGERQEIEIALVENRRLREKNERLLERLGPRGLEVIMISGAGHYVNEKVKAEIERLRAAVRKAITLMEDVWRENAGHSDKRIGEAQDILHAAYSDEQSGDAK